jgi:hypothetical protein
MNTWIERMVECLAPEDVGGVRAEEAIAIKYQNRPKSIFKYRSDDEQARYNLENDFVWVCSPASYNDPYDSSISIAPETLTKNVIRDGVRDFIAKDLGSKVEEHRVEQILNASNPALALQELIMVDMDQVAPEHRAIFSAQLAAQMVAWEEASGRTLPASHKNSLKICSFSGTNQSIIMWSHYADQHRGYCIEYDIHSLPPEHLFVRMLYPVIYSEKLFDGTSYYLAGIRNRETFNILYPALAAFYKSPEWRYEEEWRLVIPANLVKKASPWRVPTPKCVYLGSKMPDGAKERITKICKKKGIEIYQMYLADDSFCLRFGLTPTPTRHS